MAIRNHDVLVAIEIKVASSGAETDEKRTDCGDTRFPTGVDELAMPFVAVKSKRFLFEVRDPDVGEAVAVKIGDGDSHTAVGHSFLIDRHAIL